MTYDQKGRRWATFHQRNIENLNHAMIDHDSPMPQYFFTQPHRAQPVQCGDTTVIFDDHARLLCDEIGKWPVVIGCVAWLTNTAILVALQGREVCIIVQKEDWLRPDSDDWTMERQRIQYGLLKGIYDKAAFDTGYNWQLTELEPVYCCGLLKTKEQIPPRMHHKFLVFGDYETKYNYGPIGPEDPDTDVPYEYNEFVPRAVWTGSFNMTGNATRSLENAVLLRDEAIARAYTAEWITVLGISEELDWNAEWVATNFRVGS